MNTLLDARDQLADLVGDRLPTLDRCEAALSTDTQSVVISCTFTCGSVVTVSYNLPLPIAAEDFDSARAVLVFKSCLLSRWVAEHAEGLGG